MQIYFHSCLCSYLPRVPILVEGTVHEISPGAIQKSNGLKVTCLVSLYFKSEEDTMKNEIPATIFSEILLPPPPPIFTKCIEEFYKLFSHYANSSIVF